MPQYRQPHVYLAESFVALNKLGVDMHTALLRAGGIQINSLVDHFSVHAAHRHCSKRRRPFAGMYTIILAMPACTGSS